MIICRHCAVPLPTKNQPEQDVPCNRCGASYFVAITERRPSSKTEAELKHLRIKNS